MSEAAKFKVNLTQWVCGKDSVRNSQFENI